MSPRSRTLAALAVTCAAIAAGAPAAAGATLDWQDCADGFQCTSFDVPRDYAVPEGPTIALAVIRLPATDPSRRIGSLFINFGGPGGDAVSTIHDVGKEVFASLNERFDSALRAPHSLPYLGTGNGPSGASGSSFLLDIGGTFARASLSDSAVAAPPA